MSDGVSETVQLSLVGDVFINRPDPEHALEGLHAVFSESHVRFGNSEGMYAENAEGDSQAPAVLLAPPRMIAGLVAAGFDVMSAANNKSLHCGYGALNETLTHLRANGIEPVGAGDNEEMARRPVVVERGRRKIAFLAYTCTYPQGVPAGPTKPGAAAVRIHTFYKLWHQEPGTLSEIVTVPDTASKRAFLNDVARARIEADIVVVSVHWGVTSVPAVLAGYERDLGLEAIDAGADVVLGGGQHLPKSVELYRGRPIIYGLGDCILDYPSPWFHADQGRQYVAQCRIAPDSEIELSLIPARLNEVRAPVPTDPESPEFEEELGYLRRITADAHLATTFRRDGGRIVVEPASGDDRVPRTVEPTHPARLVKLEAAPKASGE